MKAGLNPGIALTIWSVIPFLAAVADRILYKVSLQTYHIVGILFMILCGVCVSCSGLLKTTDVVDATFVPTLPIVIPVLCALIMPLCVVF